MHVVIGHISTYDANWDSTLGKYVIDDSNEIRGQLPARYYISNDVIENITPANGFEEIISDMLFKQLNGSAWKQIREEPGKNRYLTYAVSNDKLIRTLYRGPEGDEHEGEELFTDSNFI